MTTSSPAGVEMWLVTGVPGAGKSTVAQAFAASQARGAHIEGDSLARLVVGGRELPREPPTEESERQIQLNVRNQCLLATSLMSTGFSVCIDYVVNTRRRLLHYQLALAPAAIHFVVLAPPWDVVRERDRSRSKRAAEYWRGIATQMEDELRGVGLWIDNAQLDVEGTIEAMRAGSDRARLETWVL